MSPGSLPPSPTAGADDVSRNTPPVSLDSKSPATSSSAVPSDPVKLTARSCLYELCAKSHWKRPVFDCCNEQGPSNLRSFTYKVIVEITEGTKSRIMVECIGKPEVNKKTAAESAAEGALWYIVRLGYAKKPEGSKKLR